VKIDLSLGTCTQETSPTNYFFAIMQKQSIVGQKSFDFSKRIILFHLSTLKKYPSMYPLSTQLLKSGTSIGANIEEGLAGYSDRDLMSKFGIALKEAREAKYWLRLFRETLTLNESEINELLYLVLEIIKIITAILKTMKLRVK